MPVITKPNLHFDAPIWTGVSTSSAITISSLNFQPDLVWGKSRTSGYTHGIHDSVRGTAAGRLQSNAVSAEVAPGSFAYGSVSAFNSNGFTASPGSSTNENWNETSSNHVAWCWKAGGAAVANTSGTITSQVSVNATAGFSIVTYTGTGAGNATVGHGLGVKPAMIIVKSRNRGTYGWNSWHQNITDGYYIALNSPGAQDNSVSIFPAGGVTNTVWNTGVDSLYNNQSTITYVAYCWTPIAGYSAFGSYTGNGSTDGPFVYTGFRPKFVLVKASSNSTASTVWNIWDTSRSPSNAALKELYPNSADAEGTDSNGADLLSNGFKPRRNSEYANSSGWTYIYAAFAEAPFKYANAR
jgi:hypothetical protein